MTGIKNREEMLSTLEGLLSKAESGPLAPEDISQFQDVVACARDYVPEFNAGGGMEDGLDEELPDELGESPMPPMMPSPAEPMLGGSSPKTSMLPPYTRRGGR